MKTSEITKTIIFMKEPQNDGTLRYRRIPWDLIHCPSFSGISPAPMHGNFDDPTLDTAGTDKIKFVDDLMYLDEDIKNEEIDDIVFFDSELEFLSLYEHTFGYYKGDSAQSNEFGYPRT